jgi:hypothetical protein
MKKMLLVAVLAYFLSKYIIEPSPIGGIVSGVLGPLGTMVSGLFGGITA